MFSVRGSGFTAYGWVSEFVGFNFFKVFYGPECFFIQFSVSRHFRRLIKGFILRFSSLGSKDGSYLDRAARS